MFRIFRSNKVFLRNILTFMLVNYEQFKVCISTGGGWYEEVLILALGSSMVSIHGNVHRTSAIWWFFRYSPLPHSPIHPPIIVTLCPLIEISPSLRCLLSTRIRNKKLCNFVASNIIISRHFHVTKFCVLL